jgi:hypothetical protein
VSLFDGAELGTGTGEEKGSWLGEGNAALERAEVACSGVSISIVGL